MFRPFYEDDSLNLTWDRSLTAAANGSISATFPVFVGASNYTISIPRSVTGFLKEGVSAEINSFHIAEPSLSGAYRFTINKLLAQPSQGAKRYVAINPSFSASWVSAAPVSSEFKIIADTPTRYLRLKGMGVTALTGSLASAAIWANNFSQGV